MLTLGKFREMTRHSKGDAEIILNTGEEIVHVMQDGRILLSPTKPIGYCRKCGQQSH